MQPELVTGTLVERVEMKSSFLKRTVIVDFFLPKNVADPSDISLLLINDGQDMKKLGLEDMLNGLYETKSITPLLCVAIHTCEDRKMEYGVAGKPDYLGRGAKADLYTSYILQELLPYIQTTYVLPTVHERGYAGFSLGAVSALDIAWTHPGLFTKVGIFSGSLWWRSIDQTDPGYDDHQHRIVHQLIKNQPKVPGMKFFFQCGNLDETMDRNNNGIIDSIDDTLDLMDALYQKGYTEKDIVYMELADGRHDVPTWARAMPEFLKWGWGENSI